MSPFLILFTIITAISLLITLGIFFLRRCWGQAIISREHINPTVFEFFTILYSIFIGFAIVTLWTAFLAAKSEVTKEADALLSAYRIAKSLPHTEDFRQAIENYVTSVIRDEWPRMEEGSMSPESGQLFEEVWNRFYQIDATGVRAADIHSLLSLANQQRLSRAIILHGNLYPPVWGILVFGLIGVVYSLYFINREQTVVSLIFVCMVIFLVLACLYFIYDLDSPFSGYVHTNSEVFEQVLAQMRALH